MKENFHQTTGYWHIHTCSVQLIPRLMTETDFEILSSRDRLMIQLLTCAVSAKCLTLRVMMKSKSFKWQIVIIATSGTIEAV